MNAGQENQSAVTIRPPQLIQSLMGGFNTVANNVHLILAPILLDLLLWFGPRLRFRNLVWPFIQDMFETMRQSGTPESLQMIDNLQEIWGIFLEHFNLTSALSTFPIGLPSMMAGRLPLESPLGNPQIVEVRSLVGVVFGWLGFSLAGLILGSLYLAALARYSAQIKIPQAMDEKGNVRMLPARVPPLRADVLAWQTLQLIGLVLLLFIVLMVILIPAILLSSFLALISLGLAQIALLLISFSAIWFLAPVIFTPQGIFAAGQNLFHAILTSTRVVRYSLPGVGLFLLTVIVLYQGLGILWQAAPDTSWMALVGIFGNAFVSTALLAASFVYYRSGLEYVQSIRKRV